MRIRLLPGVGMHGVNGYVQKKSMIPDSYSQEARQLFFTKPQKDRIGTHALVRYMIHKLNGKEGSNAGKAQQSA